MKKATEDRGTSLAWNAFTPKKRFNPKQFCRKVMKVICFIVLISASAYGFRQMLVAVPEPLAYGMVLVVSLALTWIVLE